MSRRTQAALQPREKADKGWPKKLSVKKAAFLSAIVLPLTCAMNAGRAKICQYSTNAAVGIVCFLENGKSDELMQSRGVAFITCTQSWIEDQECMRFTEIGVLGTGTMILVEMVVYSVVQ